MRPDGLVEPHRRIRGDEGIAIMGISDRFGRRAGFRPRAGAAGRNRGTLVVGAVAVAAAGGLAAASLAVSGSALAAGQPGQPGRAGRLPALAAAPAPAPQVTTTSVAPPADGYQFVELGSRMDKTFNQLFGINNNGRIAGEYGFGDPGHPNRGYTMTAPYAQRNIKAENFPHALQTEVFGLNDINVQVGEYSTQNKSSGIDNSFGWYFNGSFHRVVFPTTHNSSPTQDELSAVNNHDIAVGTFKNSSGRFQSFTFNIKTGKYTALNLPGVPSTTTVEANGINNAGDIVGSVGDEGFIKLAGGGLHRIVVIGASETIALGVNDNDTVVGAYEDGGAIHGFLWKIGGTFKTDIDDPNADAESFPIGINNEGDIVGSYLDSSGHTDGFLAYPAF
jgi:hypothetical protein